MKEKASFIVYYDWEDVLDCLTDSQTAAIFRAMFNYAKKGIEPKFDEQALNVSFCFIKRAIDRDKKNYESRCRKNAENISKRWNKDSNESETVIQSYTNHTDKEKDKEKDKDKDKDKEKDKDKDKDKDKRKENNSSTSSSPTVMDGVSFNTYSDDFLVFWKAYPRKVGKGEAYKVWKKLNLTKKEKADIQSALIWQQESAQWIKSDGQYIPYPSTYLSQRRWEDEPREFICGDITDPNRYIDDNEDDFDFLGGEHD